MKVGEKLGQHGEIYDYSDKYFKPGSVERLRNQNLDLTGGMAVNQGWRAEEKFLDAQEAAYKEKEKAEVIVKGK